MSQFASRDFKPSQQYKHTVVIRRNEYVACGTRFYSQIAGSMSFLTRAAALEIRPITRFIIVLAMLAIGVPSTPAEQQPSLSFQVPKNDLAKAQALANQLAALSPRVDPKEATLVAECAYATADRLRRQYQMFGTPIFNNFLVYHGFRKRGYCYQWTADLLVALDALTLKTLELHWGEAYAGTWRENNCLVITAKGHPFDSGMILDAWRHFGHLHWHLVHSDEDRYFENTKYAQLVRTRAASKPLGANGHVALQTKVAGKGKARDR